MDDIIQKILQIETKAKQIIEDSHDEEQNINNELCQDIIKMQEDIWNKIERKKEQIIKKELDEASEKVEETNLKMKNKIKEMVNYAQQNRGIWEEQLIERIIGR